MFAENTRLDVGHNPLFKRAFADVFLNHSYHNHLRQLQKVLWLLDPRKLTFHSQSYGLLVGHESKAYGIQIRLAWDCLAA